MARENKPSVIFIDEIDALCGPRGEGESEASRRIKTEILVQMDGVGNDSKGILVLGATNIPWQLDAAIRRRFQRRVHIGLPDLNGRARMFKLAIGDTDTALVASDYNILAAKSEGMSGSDIATAAVREGIKQEARDDTPAALDAVWEEEQIKFLGEQSCASGEEAAHQKRFAGAVAPQYLNLDEMPAGEPRK